MFAVFAFHTRGRCGNEDYHCYSSKNVLAVRFISCIHFQRQLFLNLLMLLKGRCSYVNMSVLFARYNRI